MSSCENEVLSIVSSVFDRLFVRRCPEFILDAKMIQARYTDSSSMKQFVSYQGYGRVRSIQREKLRGLTFTYPYKFQHQRCGTKEAFGCVDGRSKYVTLHVEGHEPAGEVA